LGNLFANGGNNSLNDVIGKVKAQTDSNVFYDTLYVYTSFILIMTQVYKIDESKIGAIKKRNLFRVLRPLILLWTLVAFVMYFASANQSIELFWTSIIFGSLVLILPVYVGVNRMGKSYATLEISLDDSGIDMKADMIPYKKIRWENLLMREKSNGTIVLIDKSVIKFFRMWKGHGVILIPPEMRDIEKLLNQVRSRVNY
jgi:hypothetical protein